LEQAKEEKEAHGEIETPHPGFLLGQDTCYIGYIKGVGKIYQCIEWRWFDCRFLWKYTF